VGTTVDPGGAVPVPMGVADVVAPACGVFVGLAGAPFPLELPVALGVPPSDELDELDELDDALAPEAVNGDRMIETTPRGASE
jgi:hypothetical protein